MSQSELHELMTATEVAEAFRVSIKAVGKWARSGDLASLQTPGGRRRYRRADVEAFLKSQEPAA